MISTPHILHAKINHSLAFKGGSQTVEVQPFSVQMSNAESASLTAEPFSGPLFSINYSYYTERISWLALSFELGYFDKTGVQTKGPQFTYQNTIVESVINVNANVIPLKFGPKIALLSVKPEEPWESSNLYVGGGGALYLTSIEREGTLTIVYPSYAKWSSTDSKELKGKSSANGASFSGYMTIGTFLSIQKELALIAEYGYDFYFGGSTLSGGISLNW